MKTKTIAWLASILIVVNIGLGVTIYFLLKPEAKHSLVNKVNAVEVPQLPKVEVTEEDVEAVKNSVKTKLYERAQLTPEESVSDESSGNEGVAEDLLEKKYIVEEWGLTFHLPESVEKYTLTLKKDVLTIERHLQVMAYIARYDAGFKPSINGQWEPLASYQGSDFYLRIGSSVVGESADGSPAAGTSGQIDSMREDVYDNILQTYHFRQE